jgi:hypothetical protein
MVTVNAAIVDVPIVTIGRHPMNQYRLRISRFVALIPAVIKGESRFIFIRPPRRNI